jgi:hypothetical protein
MHIVQRRDGGQPLGKEARLNLLGDFEFAGCALFGFEAVRLGTAAGVQFPRGGIEAGEGKGVAVRILKAQNAPPHAGVCGGMAKETPRADHSWYFASTSSVRKVTNPEWPTRCSWFMPGMGLTSARSRCRQIKHLNPPSKSSLVHFGSNLSRDLHSSSLVPPILC